MKKAYGIATALALILALSVGLVMSVPVFADDPPESTVPADRDGDGFLDNVIPNPSEIPPFPAIPRRAEYEAGYSVPQWTSSPSGGNTQSNGEMGDCFESQVFLIDYWTAPVPTAHGGGTAEGYSGLYYWQTARCTWYIQPVTGTRITYGGEVDMCRTTGRSARVYPPAANWWDDSAERRPCNMLGARVISNPKAVVPGIKWRVNGTHYADNQEGSDVWYDSGITNLTKRVP